MTNFRKAISVLLLIGGGWQGANAGVFRAALKPAGKASFKAAKVAAKDSAKGAKATAKGLKKLAY